MGGRPQYLAPSLAATEKVATVPPPSQPRRRILAIFATSAFCSGFR